MKGTMSKLVPTCIITKASEAHASHVLWVVDTYFVFFPEVQLFSNRSGSLQKWQHRGTTSFRDMTIEDLVFFINCHLESSCNVLRLCNKERCNEEIAGSSTEATLQVRGGGCLVRFSIFTSCCRPEACTTFTWPSCLRYMGPAFQAWIRTACMLDLGLEPRSPGYEARLLTTAPLLITLLIWFKSILPQKIKRLVDYFVNFGHFDSSYFQG